MANNSVDEILGEIESSKKSADKPAEKTIMMNAVRYGDNVSFSKDYIKPENEEAYDESEDEYYEADEQAEPEVAESENTEVTEEEYQEYLREKKERNKKIKAKNRHRRTFSHILGGVLLSVLIVSVSAFFSVYIIKAILDFTAIGKTYCQAQVHIEEGDTIEDISMDLANLGIINMPKIFTTYTKITGKDDKFVNGSFTVDTTMSYSTLLSNLQTISTIDKTVTVQITEGMTIEEIAAMLEENLVCRAEDFENLCKTLDPEYKFQKKLENEPLKYYQMEGYIFPDTYEFYILPALEDNNDLDTTEYAADVLDKIYQNFNNKLTARYYNRMKDMGLSLDETITLASIVQREADNKSNMGNVASVFYNRMAIPDVYPKLESDVTVIYPDTYIKPHMSSSEYKKYHDAYSTYDTDGIPVGPICNPGMDAIKAVLYPPETEYYYFCAHPETTVMYFATTIEEHEENLRECGLYDALAD